MKITKRILAMLLSVCILATLFTGVVSAAGNGNVSYTVSPNTGTVTVGDTVTVTISHKAATLAAVGLYLSFDKTLLECTNITGLNGNAWLGVKYYDNDLGEYANQKAQVGDSVAETNSDGKFSFGAAIAADVPIQAGNVATLTFTAIKDGTVSFSLEENSSGTDKYVGVAQTSQITISPAPVAVSGVTLDKDSMSLTVGQTGSLQATVNPTGATNKSVTWSSDNESVATVSDGTVTAVAPGTANITVTTVDGSKTASCTVTVSRKPIAVSIGTIASQPYTGSALAPDVEVTSTTGETLTKNVDYTVGYADNTYVGTANVKVADVDTSNYTFSDVTRTFAITAVKRTLSSSNTTSDTAATVVKGSTLDLAGLVSNNAGVSDGISFAVASGSAATVSGTTLTAAADQTGEVTITVSGAAYDAGGSDAVEYTAADAITIYVKVVNKANAGVSFSGTVPAEVSYSAESFQLTAGASSTGANGKWTWTSSNTDVLTVDSTGKVTVVGKGKATITATYESDTTLGHVTSEDITVGMGKVTVTANSYTIKVGEDAPVLAANAYTVSGLKSGETLETAGITVNVPAYAAAPDTSKAGTYSIVVSGTDQAANYTVTYLPGTLTIVEEGSFPWLPILGAAAGNNPFSDVKSGDWFYDEVLYVYNNGLMTGMTVDSFAPNGTMTRAMVWTVLGRMAGETFEGTGTNWYSEAQAWAMRTGVSDGTNPNGAITREELVTMLWRFVGEPEADAEALRWYNDDETVSDWAKEAMAWAVECSIVEGSNWNLTPKATALRCQVAAIFMRYCKYC